MDSQFVIYNEGQEIQEMFFIEKGEVGIGFSYYMNDIIE
jgi:antitoxin component YwqK of YwqJK toxin-antitoxin module